MDEFIKREALLKSNRWLALSANDIAMAKSIILGQPAADVVEVRHGEWIMGVDIADYEYGTCSVCGYDERDAFPTGRTPNYCPNCGAKMDGKGEGE